MQAYRNLQCNHEIWVSRIVGTLFIIKPQIGSKNFLKSTWLANFHKISTFESQNTIVILILKFFEQKKTNM